MRRDGKGSRLRRLPLVGWKRADNVRPDAAWSVQAVRALNLELVDQTLLINHGSQKVVFRELTAKPAQWSARLPFTSATPTRATFAIPSRATVIIAAEWWSFRNSMSCSERLTGSGYAAVALADGVVLPCHQANHDPLVQALPRPVGVAWAGTPDEAPRRHHPRQRRRPEGRGPSPRLRTRGRGQRPGSADLQGQAGTPRRHHPLADWFAP